MFELNRLQPMFVQVTFFGAYLIGSVIYFIILMFWGDTMSKMGYKNGIILGLLISAAACAGFYTAADIRIYGLFLWLIFILGIGFILLHIAANPYVALLGKPETVSGRLNLSQVRNSFGTTISHIIGGYFVFSIVIICLLIVMTFSVVNVALWTVIAVGLFNSIKLPNIFTIAIKDLGQHTSQGLSLFVMMILGGTLVPLVQGWFAYMMVAIIRLFIQTLCYIYLAFYRLKGHSYVFKKGIT